MAARNDPLFDALRFRWDRGAVPSDIEVHPINRPCALFHQRLAGIVWDASMLEGNPLTIAEVQTLLDGVTVGGHRLADQQRVLDLIASSKSLLSLVKNGRFALDEATFVKLHGLVRSDNALELEALLNERNEHPVAHHAAQGGLRRYEFQPTDRKAQELGHAFDTGVTALATCSPFERGLAFFQFGALQRFFVEGNTYTSQLMMNGILMSAGIDAVTVPAASREAFNDLLAEFYRTRDATAMMVFLVDCHPDATGSPRGWTGQSHSAEHHPASDRLLPRG